MVTSLKDKIKERLFNDYYKLFAFSAAVKEDDLRAAVNEILDDIITYERRRISREEKELVVQDILQEMIGFGPLEDLLRDDTVTEIMINGPKKIFIERDGKMMLTDAKFENEQHLMHIVQKMFIPTRRHVDETTPYTDIRLLDGSRVNVIIPPLALTGSTVTIRKFSKEIKLVDDLIRRGTLDQRMADFLVAAVKAKVNIIFSGATGAGKTTTLNVLSSYISTGGRIISIEDTAELTLNQENWVSLEARQAGLEGKGAVSIRDLFKNSLRMRPDRIIIGELRAGEALDMLQAISSGHRGSLAVIHANSPSDVISRLEMMILLNETAIGLEGIRRYIASTVNLIVQQEQLPDGTRRIMNIAEVRGVQNKEITVEDIFTFDIEGMDAQGKVIGRWRATGVVPLVYSHFKKQGVDLPVEIFQQG